TAWSRTSTMMLAAASEPATPQKVASRAPTISPPTWVSGSSVLTASRTNLSSTAGCSRKGVPAGNSIHQPAPAMPTVAILTSTTRAMPAPTLAIARPTSSIPNHNVSPMPAAIPPHQAMPPTCASARTRMKLLNANGWPAGGVVVPIVVWSGPTGFKPGNFPCRPRQNNANSTSRPEIPVILFGAMQVGHRHGGASTFFVERAGFDQIHHGRPAGQAFLLANIPTDGLFVRFNHPSN